MAASRAVQARIDAKRAGLLGQRLPDFDAARADALFPSKRGKRKTPFGNRVGWSVQEDDVMLRGLLWCAEMSAPDLARSLLASTGLTPVRTMNALTFCHNPTRDPYTR